MLIIIYLIAIVAEAMSGALAAGRRNMDVFGVAVIAFVTALGGGTVRDVGTFGQAQPFDLDLLTVNGRTLEGNCDLCFLKPRGQRLALIKARPEAAVWWIRMESLNLASKPSGARFRADGPSYADLARFAAEQGDLFDAAEEPLACFCGE